MLKLWEVMRRCVRAGSFGCTLGVFHAGASSAQGCANGGGGYKARVHVCGLKWCGGTGK